MNDPTSGSLTFPRERRLLAKKDFDLVFQEGRKKVRPSFVIYTRPSEPPLGPRLGVVTSRKMGKAHDRNRFRRRMRELFRTHQHQLSSVDIVVVGRSSAPATDFAVMRDDFLSALKSLNAIEETS
ncbi:hypothetical protein BH09SUM1_BH09SUM1_31140 [soil metagenome]